MTITRMYFSQLCNWLCSYVIISKWFDFFLRDDYDKEVKQAKELQRHRRTITPKKPRRPDIQVYHPRRRRKTDILFFFFTALRGDLTLFEYLFWRFLDGSEPGTVADAEEWNESGSGTETETHGTELFWLDYQADSGVITSFLVHKVSAHCFVWRLSFFY